MLTFDDGPDPEGTPAILDALARAHARATFFVIAPLAQAQSELVARIVREGHEIGVHCDEHVRQSDRDADWADADLTRALARLRGLGVTPRWWRTPWGDVAPFTGELAHRHRLRLVGWTADTHDWRGDAAAAMLAATRDGLRDKAIVLAHDGIGPGALRSDVAETVAYVPLAAACARERGLTLAALT